MDNPRFYQIKQITLHAAHVRRQIDGYFVYSGVLLWAWGKKYSGIDALFLADADMHADRMFAIAKKERHPRYLLLGN